MQSSLKPPASLSMRMRAEAAIGSSSSSLASSAGSPATKGLPHIPAAASKTTLPGTRRTSTNASSSSSSSQVTQPRYPFETLSGSLDFVASSGVFADRTVMVNPAAVCVRCGEHASMCMTCTEVMAQEALNFYRKTRARGAASLFANAITQTGITKVVKFAVFKQWINGINLRRQRGQKQEFSAARAFQRSLMKNPFRAWRKFTIESVLERKHKIIEEQVSRVGLLEAQVVKAVAERNAYEQQAKWVDKVLKERDLTIAQQQQLIEEQAKALEDAKRRIIGLSNLAGPIVAYGDVVKETVGALTGDLKRRFLRAARSTTPSYDFSKCFEDPDYVFRALAKEATRRREHKKIAKLDETAETVEVLLAWTSAKSREASLVATDMKGASLQDFLPKFKSVESMDDLPSGAAILRLVVALIFERASPVSGSTLRLPSDVSVSVSVSVSDAKSSPLPLQLTESIVADVKAAVSTQKETVEKALQLAHRHLHVPLFKVSDILDGEAPATLALLGHLMLASSSASVHPHALQSVGEMIRIYETVEEAALRKASVIVEPIIHLNDRLLEFRGLKEIQVPLDVSVDVGLGFEDDVVTAAPTDGGQVGDSESPPPSCDEGQGVAVEDGKLAKEKLAAKVAELNDPLAKYTRLLGAVDACLASLFPPVGDSQLLEQVRGVKASVEEVTMLGAGLDEIEVGRDAGMRLATEVRSGVAAFHNEFLFKQLGFTAD